MERARTSAAPFFEAPRREAQEWEELLRSACDTLTTIPEELMNSISVTGKLNGVDGEALDVLTLSKGLAAEYGVEQVVEVKGHSFTARFYRREPKLKLVKRGDTL